MGIWADQLNEGQRAACDALGLDWDAECEDRLAAIMKNGVSKRVSDTKERMVGKLPPEKQTALVDEWSAKVEAEVAAEIARVKIG